MVENPKEIRGVSKKKYDAVIEWALTMDS